MDKFIFLSSLYKNRNFLYFAYFANISFVEWFNRVEYLRKIIGRVKLWLGDAFSGQRFFYCILLIFELWHLSLDFIVSLNVLFEPGIDITLIVYLFYIPSFTLNFVFGFFIYNQTPIVSPNLNSGWKIVQLRLFLRESI